MAGLVQNGDIVPLTESFELIEQNRYLITERFRQILSNQGQVAIKYANTKDAEATEKLLSDYVKLEQDFDQAMNEVFGLDKITWETRVKN